MRKRLLCLQKIIFGVGKKDSLKDKILLELLYCPETHQKLLLRDGFCEGAGGGEANTRAAPPMGDGRGRAGREGAREIPRSALQESGREHPQKSKISWLDLTSFS